MEIEKEIRTVYENWNLDLADKLDTEALELLQKVAGNGFANEKQAAEFVKLAGKVFISHAKAVTILKDFRDGFKALGL